MVKTNNFYGLELNKVSEVYVLSEPVCHRTIYIHPDVVKQNGEINFPNKPIENCDIVEINYFKALMVVPGNYTLRFFDTNGGDIWNVFGEGRIKNYDEETYKGEFTRAIILCSDKDVKIEWVDNEKRQWITIIKSNGDIETIPNPNPVEYEEDDD